MPRSSRLCASLTTSLRPRASRPLRGRLRRPRGGGFSTWRWTTYLRSRRRTPNLPMGCRVRKRHRPIGWTTSGSRFSVLWNRSAGRYGRRRPPPSEISAPGDDSSPPVAFQLASGLALPLEGKRPFTEESPPSLVGRRHRARRPGRFSRSGRGRCRFGRFRVQGRENASGERRCAPRHATRASPWPPGVP